MQALHSDVWWEDADAHTDVLCRETKTGGVTVCWDWRVYGCVGPELLFEVTKKDEMVQAPGKKRTLKNPDLYV